ncbi:mitochondrial enolase superfamily member 1 [Grus japonensis]|uniref:Mitochondrial enolase superfamily member 1 n=1 Tax=Grus japonensis TaxID=30415 RepID=A0ABC9WUZ7_GRUJA
MPLVTDVYLDIEPLTATLLSATIQPIPYAPSGPSIKSMSLQFRDKDVIQDSIKCFTRVQVDDISCSALIYQQCNAIIEGHHVCQARFALSEAMLAVTNRLLIFHVPEHSFQEDLLHDLARHRVSGNFTRPPRLLRYDREWPGHFIRQLPQDLWMHLIRSHGPVHLQVP